MYVVVLLVIVLCSLVDGKSIYDSLSPSETTLIKKCLDEEGLVICDDMEFGIDAVIGCDDDETGQATYCSSTSDIPPTLSIIGRGFGLSGQKVFIGDSECQSVSSNNYTLAHNAYYMIIICDDYERGSSFSNYVTVINDVGHNITGKASVHFSPPIITSVQVNSSDNCIPSENSLICTSTTVITFFGKHFPIQGIDYPFSFIGDDDDDNSVGVRLHKTESHGGGGPPCRYPKSIQMQGHGSPSILQCLLQIPTVGSDNSLLSSSGVYIPLLWWGSISSVTNFTIEIPSSYGTLSNIWCSDETLLPFETSIYACQYQKTIYVEGSWFANSKTDYSIVMYSHTDVVRNTNYTCEITTLEYLSGSKIRLSCDPQDITMSTLYHIDVYVNGVLFRIDKVLLWLISPTIDSVSGCLNQGRSTVKCPTKHQRELLIRGTNLHYVTDLVVAGFSCDMNRTLVREDSISCFIPKINYPIIGVEGRVMVFINVLSDTASQHYFESSSNVFASFMKRPELHSASCTLTEHTGQACPTVDGEIIIHGSGFDIVPWMNDTTEGTAPVLFIGNIECDYLIVVNSTLLLCNEYSLRHRTAHIYMASDPTFDLSLKIGDEESVTNTQLTFRSVPVITMIKGCPSEGCSIRGMDPITVVGANFTSNTTALLEISESPCQYAEVISATEIVCHRYEKLTTRQAFVRLRMNGEWSDASIPIYFIAMCTPIDGKPCAGHGICTQTAECVCRNSPTLGYWSGTDCSDCLEGYFGMECTSKCLCSEYGVCDYGVNATGLCTSCARNYSGSTCTPCPGVGIQNPDRTSSDFICGGHGICNDTSFGDGSCTCDSENWNPSTDCFDCSRDYFGSNCDGLCPGGFFCSGHGKCSNLRSGTGMCSCDVSWGDTDCHKQCPGSVVVKQFSNEPLHSAHVLCSGHGTCESDGTCICYSNAIQGFWTKDDCSYCDLGWSGESCTEICVIDSSGLECYGHGKCGDSGCDCYPGYCGTDCFRTSTECALAVCPNDGTWGNPATCARGTCSCTCPILNNNICNNAGQCDSGEYGTGRCICNPGIAGVFCQHDCTACFIGGGGECDAAGICICKLGYAGIDCDIPCPGADVAMPCGGETRGICSDGHFGTGDCTCHSGHAGTGCTIECQGGASTPCSDHGSCSLSDGSCNCYSESVDGYWSGITCDICEPPFLPPFCNETCPGYPGWEQLPDIVIPYTCSGHGVCDVTTRKCICDRESSSGSWGGVDCGLCERGFFGANCVSECPGGACNPCSGHGTCDDGNSGSGACHCAYGSGGEGYWVGNACDTCADGYYGISCTDPCPGLGTPEGVCRGRGFCSKGHTGTGACICTVAATQFWMGSDCNECIPGYYGSLCADRCPSVNTFICSGHGVCDDGVAGYGNCTSCTFGWSGPECGYPCPGYQTPIGVCGNHGSCYWDDFRLTANCLCSQDSTVGYWSGDTCSSCSDGYYSSTCTQKCPGSGTPCSGRGVTASCDVITGHCVCQSGWAGKGCEVECAGGAITPCSNHGTCSILTGKCSCHTSQTKGYWTGVACDRCHPNYMSPDTGCHYQCPLAAPCVGCTPIPCSGYGQCVPALNGSAVAVCITCSDYATQRCGNACQDSGPAICQRHMCSGARWGSQCQNWCPGASADAPLPCSNHGLCDQGKAGSGQCVCDSGYVGDICELKCPNCRTNRGVCNAQATCTCNAGFAGTLCEKECPGTFRSPCGQYNTAIAAYELHGTCDDGALGTGDCTCDVGWRGAGCTERCLGMLDSLTSCSGNGDCIQLKSSCNCYSDSISGYWGSADCSRCAPGWVGGNCTLQCVNGTTDISGCICHNGFYGPSCSDECSGKVTINGLVKHCNARGNCSDGNTGTGKCTCLPDYYGETCQTHCVVSDHCQTFRKEAVICGPTGCECIHNNTHGYWSGSICESCERNYWGSRCLTLCRCSGNQQLCDQLTGKCECYSNPQNGYYDGDQCQYCKQGYIGTKCQTTDIKITRSAAASAAAPVSIQYSNMKKSFMLKDLGYRRVIVASTPPAVFEVIGNAPKYAQLLSDNLKNWEGNITYGTLSSDTVELVNEHPTLGMQLITLFRNNLTIKHTTSLFLLQAVAVRSVSTLNTLPTPNLLFSVSLPNGIWCFAYGPTTGGSASNQISSAYLKFASVSGMGPRIVHKQQLAAYAHLYFVIVQGETIFIGGILQQKALHDITILSIDTSKTSDLVRAAVSFRQSKQLELMHTTIGDGMQYEKITTVANLLYAAIRRGPILYVVRIDKSSIFDTTKVEQLVDCSSASGRNCSAVFEVEGTWTVKSISIDTASNEGYISVNALSSTGSPLPAFLYRFNSETVQVSGSTQLTYHAGQAEEAADVVVFEASSTVFALPGTSYLRIITMNTYFVESVTPSVADSRGGSPITVIGKGFPSLSIGQKPLCRIAGLVSEVKSFNSTTVVCVTLPTETGSSACAADHVDVSFAGPDRYTNNDNAKLRRVFSATPVYASPSKGLMSGGMNVSITGYGFDNGGYLLCVFYDDSFETVTPGYYHRSTLVTCIQPSWPRPSHHGKSFIKITQDGVIKSVMKVPYEIVGTLVSLRVPTELKIPSGPTSSIPPLQMNGLDSEGHVFFPLVTENLILTIQQSVSCIPSSVSNREVFKLLIQHSLPSTEVHLVSEMPFAPLQKGRGTLEGLYLRRPRAAICTAMYEVYSSLSGIARSEGPRVRQQFEFEIVAGDVDHLGLVEGPVGEIDTNRKISPLPVLELLDAAGNLKVPNPDQLVSGTLWGIGHPGSGIEVTGQLMTFQANPFTGMYECTCNSLTMSADTTLFGVKYQINLTVIQDVDYLNSVNETVISGTQTSQLERISCERKDMQAVVYTPLCRLCPEGGICDGTASVGVAAGYWRWQLANYSTIPSLSNVEARSELQSVYTRFYKCQPTSACTPTAEGALCRDGHDQLSILCMRCSSGYGFAGDICEKCHPLWLTIILFILIIAAWIVAIGLVIALTFKGNIKGSKSMGFVQFKQMFTWAQTCAMAAGSATWPSGLHVIFELEGKLLTFSGGIGPVSCLLHDSYYTRWLIVILLPILAIGVITIVSIALQVYAALSDEEDQETMSFDTSITFLSTEDEVPDDGPQSILSPMMNLLGFLVPSGKTTVANQNDKPQQKELSRPRNASISALARVFHLPKLPDLFCGSESELLVVKVSRPPPTDVSLIPTGSGLTFVPPVLSFTADETMTQFSVVGNILGTHDVMFRVSGADRKIYPCPEAIPVQIFGEWKTGLIDKIISAMIVFFFFTLPAIVKVMIGLFVCDQLGPNNDHYLLVDPNTECYTSSWWGLATWNIVLLSLYAILLPGVTALYMHCHKDRLDEALIRSKVAFLSRGLRTEYWHWEFVIMFRKIIVAIIATYSRSLWNRLYLIQWTLVVFLCLNVLYHPFTAGANHVTETMALGAQIVTMNLALIYFTDDLSELVRNITGIVLLVLKIGTSIGWLTAYIYVWKTLFVLEGRHKKFQTALLGEFDEDGDGEVTWKEVFIGMKDKLKAFFKSIFEGNKPQQAWRIRGELTAGYAAVSMAAAVLPFRENYFMQRQMATAADLAEAEPEEMTHQEWVTMKQHVGINSPVDNTPNDIAVQETSFITAGTVESAEPSSPKSPKAGLTSNYFDVLEGRSAPKNRKKFAPSRTR